MMETYFAHSEKNEHPAESYCDHIKNTKELAMCYGREIKPYCRKDAAQIENILSMSAEYHDQGKLDKKNQELLHQKETKRRHLPVNHVDAGAAFLKKMKPNAFCSLMLVYAHHKGLPDFTAEAVRSEEQCFRDEYTTTRNHVDQELEQLIRIHRSQIPEYSIHRPEYCEGDPSMFIRMLLSCLADADYSDTASAYGKPAMQKDVVPELHPECRLEALNHFVHFHWDEEQIKWYELCRDSQCKSGIVFYDGPENEKKFKVVMAYQLKQAVARKARRIFVVLPDAGRVKLAVKSYRESLKLEGEKAEDVVAELHEEADFGGGDIHDQNALWSAPIIVTTTSFFFEMMASNRPGRLRHLHELPGSIISVDGAYAGLPLKLLPLAWRWIKILEEEWNCCWVLTSGSLIHFWEIPELVGTEEKQVSEMVAPELCNSTSGYEKNKIKFSWNSQPLSREKLEDWVMEKQGPRIIIMNTAQNAAVIARDICKKYGRNRVEHLSEALTSEDYNGTIDVIKGRLANPEDTDWVLVATSCVEAEMDLSFHSGFREMSSVLSLLQAAEIIDGNDSCKDFEMWSFSMQDDIMLVSDPKVKASAGLLKEYFYDGMKITPELCVKSVRDALKRGKIDTTTMQRIIEDEEVLNFQTVNDMFCVKERDVVSVIVNPAEAAQPQCSPGKRRAVKRYAVSIPQKNLKKWRVKQISRNVYQWTLPYDSFLGYMAGVLEQV